MLRILCVGDLHFKVGNGREMEVVCREVHRIIDEEDPDLIVSMGDVLDTHERIHVAALERAVLFLKSLAKRKPTVNLIGNHDLRGPDEFLSTTHPFVALKGWPNLEIVDVGSTRTVQGCHLCFLPYVPNGRLSDAFGSLGADPQSFDIVFCHQELYGVKVGGHPSETGDRWPSNYPLIVCGHIHDYSQVSDNILYVGTPLQHAFGDPEDRSLSLLTHEGGLDWSEKRCMLNVPKKIVHRVSWGDLITHPNPVSTFAPVHELDSVKVIVSGSPSELKQAARQECIRSLQRKGVKVVLACCEEQPTTMQVSQQTTQVPFRERITSLLQRDFPDLLPILSTL